MGLHELRRLLPFIAIFMAVIGVSVSRKYTECPTGYSYAAAVKNCYMLIIDKFSWDDGRTACAKSAPGAHSVAIKSDAENQAISAYLETALQKDTGNSCVNLQYPPSGKLVWTSGQRIYQNCSLPFQWKPLPNTQTTFTYNHFLQWPYPEPDCEDNNQFCSDIWPLFSENDTVSYFWDDIDCSIEICVLCEVSPTA